MQPIKEVKKVPREIKLKLLDLCPLEIELKGEQVFKQLKGFPQTSKPPFAFMANEYGLNKPPIRGNIFRSVLACRLESAWDHLSKRSWWSLR